MVNHWDPRRGTYGDPCADNLLSDSGSIEAGIVSPIVDEARFAGPVQRLTADADVERPA